MSKGGPLDGVYFWIPECGNPNLSGHLVKIGRSTDVLRRAGGIQTASPYLLRQLWFLSVPGVSAAELEQLLHKDFARFRYHHEWFLIPTIFWKYTCCTMHLFHEGCTWQLLIDKGPLKGNYLPKSITPEMVDGFVADRVREHFGEAAA